MRTPVSKTILVCAVTLLSFSTCFVIAETMEETMAGKAGDEDIQHKNPQKNKAKNPRRGSGKHLKGRARFKLFGEMDENNDGVVTFLEFSSMERLANLDEAKRRKIFDFLDRNKDEKLQKRELQPREPGWLMELRKTFVSLDADHSGALDIAEFSKPLQLKGKSEDVCKMIFSKLDRNKNATIERSELKWRGGPPPRPHFDFAKYDTDNSKGLDYEEYSKIPWINKVSEERRKKLFQRIDTDGNGKISPCEVAKARRGRRHRYHGKRRPSHRKGNRDKAPPRSREKASRPQPENG